MSSTPTPTAPASCSDCGGRLVAAFAPVAAAYVRCSRCGHVFPAGE